MSSSFPFSSLLDELQGEILLRLPVHSAALVALTSRENLAKFAKKRRGSERIAELTAEHGEVASALSFPSL